MKNRKKNSRENRNKKKKENEINGIENLSLRRKEDGKWKVN